MLEGPQDWEDWYEIVHTAPALLREPPGPLSTDITQGEDSSGLSVVIIISSQSPTSSGKGKDRAGKARIVRLLIGCKGKKTEGNKVGDSGGFGIPH
ncbi:hypothetical protein GJ744_010452 [Endocarpon pusillum]|uniref:Uncharacterized protein n=1 Tax=Endocarpon pusillum TaxID=364733 RepID=A0A8H7AE24_9EURO|nr:hypothetical protein GJ744_010452 [Endocarpon pusillum]